jgi:hypothetical protein
MFDIFGHDDIAASIDVNDSAMEAWGPMISPVRFRVRKERSLIGNQPS